MCRMFGLIGEEQDGLLQLEAMYKLLPGGPDEQNLRWGSGWFLGHTRLSINGIENGSQPYTAQGLQALLVGEIYNYRELAKRFEIDLPLSASDGQVILPLFNIFGPRFVEHLEGMFSIAILDKRNSLELYLFSENCAIKPIYYLVDENQIGFASEIKGLTNLKDRNRLLDPQSFDQYATYRAILGPQTIFPKVKVLEPNTYAKFGKGKLNIRPYTPNSSKFSDRESALRDFENDLVDGVNKTLMADVPLCTTLSGGLDSSLITKLASQDSRTTHTFNVWYEGKWKEDETAYAKEVADAAGLKYRQVTIAHSDFPDKIDAMCRSLSQPNAAAHCLSTFALYEAIGRQNFKVALIGEGADDFFGGYSRIGSIANSNGSGKAIDEYTVDLAAIKPDLRSQLIRPEARNEKSRHQFGEFLNGLTGTSLTRKILEFESKHRLPYYILHRVDALSMAHSVETRVPFCLPSVIRHSTFSNVGQLIGKTRGKEPIYQAATGLVPQSIISRPKQPFLLPIAGMLKPGYPVYDLMMDTISSRKVTSSIINESSLRNLVKENQAQPSNKAGNALWAWLIFELWGQINNVRI